MIWYRNGHFRRGKALARSSGRHHRRVPAFSGGCAMRTALLASLILLCPSFAFAQKVGDRIVVTTENAPLKLRDDVVGSVPKGSVLTVKKINGDWFWVIYSGAKPATRGWIKRSDVVAFENAIEFFNSELQRTPTAVLYTIRGKIWYLKDEYDQAITDLDEAIRLDPDQSTAFLNRGSAWLRKLDFDRAIADYSEAIWLDPNAARAYFNRAIARGRKNEIDLAIADYFEAIRLDPTDAKALINRGLAWQKKNEVDLAIADYTEALRLDRKSTRLNS